jgi:uncharacterized alpha-E superfamily protein
MRLLSRNAEALYWLARYLERASSLSRVIEMQSAFGGHGNDTSWAWLLALHSDDERFKELHELTNANIISFYVTDTENPGSIRSSIHRARENARALRPFIPTDMWGQLNTFHASLNALGADAIAPSQLPRTCSKIRVGCLAQIGIVEGTLFRDEGYQFFRLGLLIERADQTSRLLDVKFAQNRATGDPTNSDNEFVFWSTILRTAAAYQVFNRLQPASAAPESVARFLILNPSHPRSVGYCVREIVEALNILRGSFRLTGANSCLEHCDGLLEGLQVAGMDARLPDNLHGFNDWVQGSLIELSTRISASFFQTPPRIATPVAQPTSRANTEAPDGGSQPPKSGSSQTQTQSQS